MIKLTNKYRNLIGYSIDEENFNKVEGVDNSLYTFSKQEYIQEVIEATVDKMATTEPAKALIKHGKEWYSDILSGVSKEFIYKNINKLTDILTDLFILEYCKGNLK